VLTIHGYRVHAVASREAAIEVLPKESIDIAIVDFYLQDETGDEVCRALLSEDPSLVCAILTSAYSDPIIKLSLRAGAVDCFFKNEAGELLLARIDALSRLVRQRKELKSEQLRLDRLVDTLAGSTLLVDDADQLTYVSQQAATKLGFADRFELVGQPATRILDPARLRAAGNGRHEAQWVNADQRAIDVVFRQIPLHGTSERMLNFKFANLSNTGAEETSPGAQSQGTGLGSGLPTSVPLPSTADPFLAQLTEYLTIKDKTAEPVSVLIIGVMHRSAEGKITLASDNAALSEAVQESIMAIYRREDHVAQLSGHRYGFLLRHSDAPQSYLLTRKIMQLANDTVIPDTFAGSGALCVNGCLLALENHGDLTAHAVLGRALGGLRAVDVRGVNQALLLDLKRMLPVYPAE